MRQSSWKVSLRCARTATKLLVTDMGNDLLKARLTTVPGHPRALVTLIEGLSLWHGAPICVAACADEDARDCFEHIFYGGGFLPPASPLVSFEVVERLGAPRRLRGLGDFRQLRLLEQAR
jgi:hypothetical protein